jgi:hypothetical protein
VITVVVVRQTDTDIYLFLCSKCESILQSHFGARRNKLQLVPILVCPSCKRIAGEWLTEQDRNNELTAFAAAGDMKDNSEKFEVT